MRSACNSHGRRSPNRQGKCLEMQRSHCWCDQRPALDISSLVPLGKWWTRDALVVELQPHVQMVWAPLRVSVVATLPLQPPAPQLEPTGRETGHDDSGQAAGVTSSSRCSIRTRANSAIGEIWGPGVKKIRRGRQPETKGSTWKRDSARTKASSPTRLSGVDASQRMEREACNPQIAFLGCILLKFTPRAPKLRELGF